MAQYAYAQLEPVYGRENVHIVFSPSHDAYVKQKSDKWVEFRVRFDMVQAAIDSVHEERSGFHPHTINVDPWEGTRDRVVDYPDVLAHYEGHNEVYYLVGADHFENHVSRNPSMQAHIKARRVIVCPRAGSDISSTKVQAAAAAGDLRALERMVPGPVLAHITRQNLYGYSAVPFKVLTYNILTANPIDQEPEVASVYEQDLIHSHRNHVRWANRSMLVSQAVARADVVMLNEAVEHQVRDIGRSARLGLAIFRRKINSCHGSAILFDEDTFESVFTFSGSLISGYSQVCVAAVLRHRHTAKDVCFVSLHLKSGYDKEEPIRILQFRAAMALVERGLREHGHPSDIPLVVAGDLNSDLAAGYAKLVTHVATAEPYLLVDTGRLAGDRMPTYNHWHPSIFDYILVRGLDTIGYHVPPVRGIIPNAIHGSDHLPVMAEIRLRSGAASDGVKATQRSDPPHPTSVQVPSLKDVLSMYTFKFFNDEEHRAFVERTFSVDTARLVVPSETPMEDVMQHMHARVPVYLGTDRKDRYKPDVVERVMGRSPGPLPTVEPQYAVVGPVQLMSSPDRRVFIVHTWGVNLESTETDHYKYKFTREGIIYPDLMMEHYKRMFTLILAARSAIQNDLGTPVRVRCPLVGIGEFLKGLGWDQKRIAEKLFVQAAAATVKGAPNFLFCIYPKGEMRGVRLALEEEKLEVKEENLMVLEPETPGMVDMVVNAWDNRSWIGNGGSEDGSVDGYVVANAYGRNNQFRNNSYLHNHVFNPSMLDPMTWVRAP